MTFETRRHWGLCAVLVLGLSGCDKGSVGEFGETEGESEGASEGQTTGASAGASSGPGSASATSTTGAATSATGTTTEPPGTESGETGLLLDVGGIGACANPLHGCSGPAECGETCGDLDSMFDENGCVRVACSPGADACGDGEFCYRPQDYGGCQSSDLSCSESDGVCGCGFDDDCGGAYCVPEDIVFGGIVEGPTEGLVTSDCAPDDGPAFSISVGSYASDACGGAFEPGPTLRFLVVDDFGTTGTTATDDWAVASASYSTDGTPETTQTAQWVVLRISAWEGTVTGDYEVLLEDETLLVGTFSTVVSCPSDVICG